MDQPIEETYFNWLCAKVMSVEIPTPSLTHWNLLKQLHNTEFVWLLSGDDNRAEDGVELRAHFFLEASMNPDPVITAFGCSILEMLIAFSSVAEFETDRSARKWFWEFLENLDLAQFNDASYVTGEEINEILQSFVWRTYDPTGRGGIFPLHYTEHDQRTVEIYYQFCEYLVDQEQLL